MVSAPVVMALSLYSVFASPCEVRVIVPLEVKEAEPLLSSLRVKVTLLGVFIVTFLLCSSSSTCLSISL